MMIIQQNLNCLSNCSSVINLNAVEGAVSKCSVQQYNRHILLNCSVKKCSLFRYRDHYDSINLLAEEISDILFF